MNKLLLHIIKDEVRYLENFRTKRKYRLDRFDVIADAICHVKKGHYRLIAILIIRPLPD